jgi:oxaloacetate decarboxylase alpha subunit
MNEIKFVDTTLRDGPTSLWAESMRTGMILPIASQIDSAGFEAIEIIATTFFKKCVRELREDPWERLRLVSQRITKTPLRAIRNRNMAAFHISPRSLSKLWLERLVANGLRQIRISDPSNTVSCLQQQASDAQSAGLESIVNLIFSISPKHTDEYYAEKAREAARLDVARICLKDPGGLLTPDRTRALVPLILENTNGIPVEFHTHCTMGLGALCCLEAIKLGIKSVNTAIPPLADGSSNPSVFNVASNARTLGYVPVIDEEVIKPVSEHFTFIAKREGLPIGRPVEYDHYHHIHQVPGGMISNLRHQLSKMGMEKRLGEVLEETGRVRAEFGYPIMVTPYSQFVGTQAAINVILGERYKEVTDEVIQYTLGLWGKEESSSVDPDVKDKILSRSRAREMAGWEPPEPSLKEMRRKLGGRGISDDDLLLRYFAGEDEVAAMRAAAQPKDYISARRPLVALIGELTQRTDCRHITIQKGDLSLHLEKR